MTAHPMRQLGNRSTGIRRMIRKRETIRRMQARQIGRQLLGPQDLRHDHCFQETARPNGMTQEGLQEMQAWFIFGEGA